MTAVNVNLRQCECLGTDVTLRHAEGHCPAKPVPIPCPIPRSVTMTVRLGECASAFCGGKDHDCPAKPIRVACSIGGETWAESEGKDAWPEKNDGYLCSTVEEFPTLLAACRARWEIIKALVLGRGPREWDWARVVTDGSMAKHCSDLFTQRDAVFAALAEMARAESTIIQRMADIDKAHTNRTRQAFRGMSADELAAYVEHLIEQVGAL